MVYVFTSLAEGLRDICIVIPAYNEGERLKDFLPQLRKFNLDIVVVDDGSTDNTGDVARESGVIVLRHERNLGKGKALQRGFNFVLERGYDAVITMDADLQHDVQDIPDFINAYRSGDADIVLGDRMLKTDSMPWVRYMVNKITSKIISVLTGCPMRDTQSGFRLIRRKVLESVTLSTSKFDMESELLIKASAQGFKIDSIPVHTIYFENRESKIRPFIDTLRFLRLVFKAVFVWRN